VLSGHNQQRDDRDLTTCKNKNLTLQNALSDNENQLTLGQMVHRRRFQTQAFYYHLYEHRTSLRAFQRKTQ
jgi:hypothetical protein